MTTDSGVSDAGLITTVLPQISAAIPFHAGIAIGKFHGVISPGHAEGHAHGHVELVGQLGRCRHAVKAAAFAGHQERHVDRFLHVAARLLQHLPHLARHLARDRFLVALEDVADGVEILGALRRGRQPPRLKRAVRGVDGGVQIVRVRLLKRADEIVVVGGIAILERLAALRRDPLAVDVVLVVARCAQTLIVWA